MSAQRTTKQRTTTRRRGATLIVALVATTSLFAAACSSDDSADETRSTITTVSGSMADEPSDTASGDNSSDNTMEPASLDPSGPACASVPASGAGSFSGMAQDPAATAASNNPELSTLVAAVTAADLGDTLNGPGPFTIFAPANAAFAKIPADTLDAVLADKAQLTEILTYHVVAGEKMSSADLEKAGTVTTVQGGDLMIADENGTVTINGSAKGVCIDVPTANATVHIIDEVLMP